MKIVNKIASILVIIGGLNWGLYGIFNQFDLVEFLFAGIPYLTNIVYILVGISAVIVAIDMTKKCKTENKDQTEKSTESQDSMTQETTI